MRDAAAALLFLVRMTAVRGLGMVSGVSVLAATGFAMTLRGAPWRGDLVWTIDWMSVGFVISGPLVAGTVAIDTGALVRGSLHLEHRWPWRSPGLGIAIGHASTVCVAQCVGLGVALSISRPPVADPFAWLAVLVQLLLLILFVSIGSLVGRLTQPLLAGLLASSLVLLLVYFFGSPSKQVTILHAGLATLPRVGYRYHWTFLAAQALIIIALIVATWLLRPVAPATSRSIPVTRWFTAVVLAIGVVGAGLVSTVDRLVPTGRPPTTARKPASIGTFFPMPSLRRAAPGARLTPPRLR